jgi:PhnB protein
MARQTKRKPAAKKAAAKKTRRRAAAKKVHAVPSGYRTVTPGFRGPSCAGAIAFLEKAFGAQVKDRYDMPDGTVAHCELRLGDSVVMCGEAPADQAWKMAAMIYVPDADATFARAVSAGAKVVEAPADKFYGDRAGRVLDPFGNEWVIATHVEDVTPVEMEKRMQAMMAGA